MTTKLPHPPREAPKPWRISNRELLQDTGNGRLLTNIELQRRHVLRIQEEPHACPSCAQPSTVCEAAGIDVDAYDFGATRLAYACPSCKRPLKRVVPIAGGWHWAIDHERERARTAE